VSYELGLDLKGSFFFFLDEKEAKNQGFAGLLAKNHSKSLNAIYSPSEVS